MKKSYQTISNNLIKVFQNKIINNLEKHKFEKIICIFIKNFKKYKKDDCIQSLLFFSY